MSAVSVNNLPHVEFYTPATHHLAASVYVRVHILTRHVQRALHLYISRLSTYVCRAYHS